MSDEEMQRCRDYVRALEAERCKIQVFQRELPLCLELVSQAIERCRQQLPEMTGEGNLNGVSECNSEQTTSDAPVLEEFIPMKRASLSPSPCHSEDDDEHNSRNHTSLDCNKNGKKSDWLRSVQLWNQTPDPLPQQGSHEKVAVLEAKRSGAFHPFKKEKSGGASPAQKPENGSASTSSSAETVGDGNKKVGVQSQRKARRCWSPELHRRFLQALQQLGGSHVATPKQIRELMKVDGLTNDEVKSHLQKYRLHTVRKSSPSTIANNPSAAVQTPQFVVVGGLWMPPTVAASTTSDQSTPTTIYAPIPTLPTQKSNTTNSDDDGGSNSDSPPASSKVTTTVQPPTA